MDSKTGIPDDDLKTRPRETDPSREHLLSATARQKPMKSRGGFHRHPACMEGHGDPCSFRGRVIALLGYELVEGRLKGGRIEELRRVNYSPQSLASQARAVTGSEKVDYRPGTGNEWVSWRGSLPGKGSMPHPQKPGSYFLTASSEAILPSRMKMTRWACCAMSCSWVTRMMVFP
jgi:hypothetical protein